MTGEDGEQRISRITQNNLTIILPKNYVAVRSDLSGLVLSLKSLLCGQ
jgi:hypothetical protein